MSSENNKIPNKNINATGKGISRRDFLKKSVATAGFWAISRNKLVGIGRNLNKNQEDQEISKRVNNLINKMTLKEKVSQLETNAPAIPRLGIPKYDWWSECLHGVARAGLATSFPQAIGMASTWNKELMHNVAIAISDEARAKHHAFEKLGLRNRYMGLTFFAPNINLVRDSRWGRGQETYGEDPYFTGHMAKWYIKGLQGDNPKYLKLVATSKHFAVYNGPEPERHKINVNVDNYDLFDTYLPAFKTTIKEADVGSVMCAYNSLYGMPCCGNNKILDGILRNDWKFNGYVVSDCGAISDFYRKGAHDVVNTAPQAAALGMNSGTDLNCGNTYSQMDEAELKGLIDEKAIDESLRRLFTARFRLGMFDSPEKVPYANIPYSVVNNKKHQKLALKMAHESIVLLKNSSFENGKGSLLPLDKNRLQSIAVIGPNADKPDTMLGNYHGTPAFIETPLKGIKKKIPSKTKVYYAQGSEIADGIKQLHTIPANMLIPSRGKGHGLYAEYFANKSFEGHPGRTQVDKIIDYEWLDHTPVTGKLAADFSVRWSGKLKVPKAGKYIIGFKGNRYDRDYKLYLDNELKLDGHKLQREFTIDLKPGKTYDIKIEYVGSGPDPQAHLKWHIPGEDLLQGAIDTAKKSDLVVLCLGLDSHLEGEEMPIHINGFDGGDRTKLDLPEPQVKLMKEIVSLGKPTILVMLSGSAVAIPWAKENIPAIVQAWYGGQSGGTAIADVLFGDYNPAGRLPVTFYKSVDDLPSFTDYNMRNRTYRYFKGEPLYPFGYGLSYTKFDYSDLKVPKEIDGKTPVEIRVSVSNTGKLKGDEVAQLYLSHMDYAGMHPIRALKGFTRIPLNPGESKELTFRLSPDDLSLVDSEGVPIFAKGRIKVSIGGQQPGFKGDLNAYTTSTIDDIMHLT